MEKSLWNRFSIYLIKVDLCFEIDGKPIFLIEAPLFCKKDKLLEILVKNYPH